MTTLEYRLDICTEYNVRAYIASALQESAPTVERPPTARLSRVLWPLRIRQSEAQKELGGPDHRHWVGQRLTTAMEGPY